MPWSGALSVPLAIRSASASPAIVYGIPIASRHHGESNR